MAVYNIAFMAVMILEEVHVVGRPFSTDDFFRLREPTFRVPMHLSPDGQLLSLTIRSRSHGKLERDQSFTPEGIPGEMVGSQVLVVDTQTGDAQTPFGPDATSWAGMWSPSGRRSPPTCSMAARPVLQCGIERVCGASLLGAILPIAVPLYLL